MPSARQAPAWVVALSLAACSHRPTPPPPTTQPASAAPSLAVAIVPAPATLQASAPLDAGADAEGPPLTASITEGGVGEPEESPSQKTDPVLPLCDEQGTPLPQTEAKPSASSRFFEWGSEALFEAIVHDKVERALPFFFPLVAYEQVKDIAQPARDWETRLVRLFTRDIHDYHRSLGKYRAEAKFLRVEVDEDRARWMKPGSEGNKVGYFRVLRSRLLYEDHEGKERELGITSLISWRGEWYVVHLKGFK
jgi:hypothetical protein